LDESKGGNRLIHETSPYLLQHARNPVDWRPWGEEAIRTAREQDKPIFLSVGYSACHWCHVMERESFEDPRTAEVMNRLFVNVKVDREERPDLDQIYMTATQLISRHGGWPMSVWLTPDLKPFYAGTYFPPEPRHGLPSFVALCEHLGRAWRERRAEVLESADHVVEEIARHARVTPDEGGLDDAIEQQAARQLSALVDRAYGGLGTAPKFPHATELRLLLRASLRPGCLEYRSLVELSLERMIQGGVYDQLGGGFHRYATDQRWLVPHFEKMLYDNALIPLALIEAAQATADESLRGAFAAAADETLEYVLREMTLPEGAFASAQDADVEGEEGKYFVWTRREIDDVLGRELGECFSHVYGVVDSGNWEDGKNILHLARPIAQAARELATPESELRSLLQQARSKLLAARGARTPPGRDDKALTSWNGMMIDALAVADGGRRGRYAEAAANAARFILERMRAPDGLLHRTYRCGRARLNGCLEDYAFFANGLVSLYEATFDPRWASAALDIVDRMIEQFWDDDEGGFFYTGRRHEPLIVRGKDPLDGATPSANGTAATATARLGKLTGRGDLVEKTERTLRLFGGLMRRSPTGSAQMIIALGLHRGPTIQAALVGDPQSEDVARALESLRRRFLPNKVVALRAPDASDDRVSPVALLAGKVGRPGELTAYLCRDFACEAPVHGVEAFREALERAASPTGP
jgi:uncharacterized protein YyaL (SSP411 family)